MTDTGTPAPKYAHELAPEPAEDTPPGAEHVRYHVARAYGLLIGWTGSSALVADRQEPQASLASERLNTCIAETGVALLMYAVHTGKRDPLAWTFARWHEESGEWLHQIGRELDIDMDRIRGYALRTGRPEGTS